MSRHSINTELIYLDYRIHYKNDSYNLQETGSSWLKRACREGTHLGLQHWRLLSSRQTRWEKDVNKKHIQVWLSLPFNKTKDTVVNILKRLGYILVLPEKQQKTSKLATVAVMISTNTILLFSFLQKIHKLYFKAAALQELAEEFNTDDDQWGNDW